MILGPFKCYFTMSIKRQQKTPAGQSLYRTLSLHIYGGRKCFCTEIKKKARAKPEVDATPSTSYCRLLMLTVDVDC